MAQGLTRIALLTGLLVAMAGAVQASDICDRLSFQLATLSQSASPSQTAQKFAEAIAAQKASLRDLVGTMRRTGCSNGSIAVIGGPNASACDAFAQKQARMARNLQILENKRIELMNADDGGKERRRLAAALDENRCNEQPVLVGTAGVDSAPLVTDEADGREIIRTPLTEDGPASQGFVALGGSGAGGDFQTLCVRACDGAFFPISSHASTMDFRRDAQVCSMMCPGNQTELFYHPIQSESSEMRSAESGQSYASQPFAYRYRTTTPGQCGCNFSLYYKEMQRREALVSGRGQAPAPSGSIVWVKPTLRGGLNEQAEARPAPAVRPYKPNPNIRVIGPAFLPDDESIDLKKPAPDKKDAG